MHLPTLLFFTYLMSSVHCFSPAESSLDILLHAPPFQPNTLALPLSSLLTTLSSLRHKPTCYRQAATSLIHHCKTLPTDLPDHDRLHFAIKLTLCELDLIHQSPPPCLDQGTWKQCVKQLSTKETWWTSFSGNLREVTNVCFLSRQEIEKDQLLELHLNLTSVQEKLLDILNGQFAAASQREQRNSAVEKTWSAFTEKLEGELAALEKNTQVLLGELFTGLLRLEGITRDSVIRVAGELGGLEEDVQEVRKGLRLMEEDISAIEMLASEKVEELGEKSQKRLSIVCPCNLSFLLWALMHVDLKCA